jgi:thymidine phosphorylase
LFAYGVLGQVWHLPSEIRLVLILAASLMKDRMGPLGKNAEKPGWGTIWTMTHIVETIGKKRDGGRLSDLEIREAVAGYVNGNIAHEQMSALLMAILLNGLDEEETTSLCQAYVASGERLTYDGLYDRTTDKHSTGGVGDKITLILTPMVMALGGVVPQLSGRGLGHTGGTLDKLEAITGFEATLPADQMQRQLREVGGFICAASEDLAPADRMIYALRDVTGTVPSIPLIAASIMSKKIAEGTKSLVLDVKTGGGAFMKTEAEARKLAEVMLKIGKNSGLETRAVITRMDEPLGHTAGNALEVVEALEVLSGGGPRDVRELCTVLAVEMLEAAGLDSSGAATVLDDGRAMREFEKLIRAQGGDLGAGFAKASHILEVTAEQDGYVAQVDAMEVATVAWHLGAGRSRKEEAIDPAAGVVWRKKAGETVRAGETLLELHTNDESRLERVLENARRAVQVSTTCPEPSGLVVEILR